VTGAVEAVLSNRPIERSVEGNVHGNDMSAGLERNWVEILELNEHLAAEGTAEKISQTVDAFRKGALDVFRGDYVGVDPENSADTYDLNQGYTENKLSSCPTFHYVLTGIIQAE